MNDWPMGSDYTAALQNPQIAFKDAELQRAQFERDGLSLPRPWSGQFAVVYHATLPNGRQMAVRAFTSPSDERAERYKAINAYLSSLDLDSLVHFAYQEKGILAGRGKRYPLLTMEWVEGNTLYEWVQHQAKHRDIRALGASCDRWRELIGALRHHRIAHGDLQDRNVMVTPSGQFKLVDYDCMCVPKLVGLPNLEIGVEPYQHPGRQFDTRLSLDLDNFSTLVIFVALRSLAMSPELWQKYVASDGYEKLLFRRNDFDHPGQSTLLRTLTTCRDTDLARMTKDLCDIFRGKIDDVPTLEDFLFSYDKVRVLLSQRLYDQAVELVERQGSKANLPVDLESPLQDARRRVACRLKLEECAHRGDEAGMAQNFQPQLLDQYPAARELVALARDSAQVVRLEGELHKLLTAGHVRELVRTWDRHARLLTGRKSMAQWSTVVSSWRERNKTCDEFLASRSRTTDNPEPLIAAWRRLLELGGHPESETHRREVELLERRWNQWQILQAAPRNPSEEADHAYAEAWKEDVFVGWDTAERERSRYKEVCRRLEVLNRLDALERKTSTFAAEQALLDAVRQLPEGYKHARESRVRQAARRIHAWHELSKALQEPISDLRLYAAWSKVAEAQAQLLVPPEYHARIELAEKRVPIIERVRRIALKEHNADVDGQLIALWDSALLHGCPDVEPWDRRHSLAMSRRKLVQRLEVAIKSRDDEAIIQCGEDESLRGYPLSPTWQRAISEARDRVGKVQELIAALRTHDPIALGKAFDAPMIRKYTGRFQPYSEQLVNWVARWLLPASRFGIRLAPATASVVAAGEDGCALRLRWAWPSPRVTDLCYVGFCDVAPGQNPDDASWRLREPVSRDAYEAGNACRIVHPPTGSAGCLIMVWGVVDLGFTRLMSEPVVLGRVPVAEQEAVRKANRGTWLERFRKAFRKR